MLRRTLPLPALALLLCAGAPAGADDPKAEALKKDLKALEGTWDVRTMIKDGKEMKVPEGTQLTLTGTKYVIKAADREIESGTFKIDPSKSPKQMDIMPADGPNKGKQVLGIYELKGDGMTAAGDDAGKNRPVDFSGKNGVVVTYKRAK